LKSSNGGFYGCTFYDQVITVEDAGGRLLGEKQEVGVFIKRMEVG
jgi:hypothetical protein